MSQTINVDMTPNSFQPSLYYSQGDIGREFKIKIVSQSGDTIPAGATVTIQATKPSGFGFSVAADSVTNGVATFTTTAEMTDEFGRFPAELKVVSGSVTIFSANFQMVGERNVHPEGTIDGSQGTIIPELTILVERVEAAASSVLDMEVEAQTLPAGSLATYSYDEDENKATFGIPQGEAGAGAAGVTASAYSASKTYAVGDYVIHNSNLYRCTTAITTAEAFTAAHWTQVVLGDDVTDVKSDLTAITGNSFASYTQGAYFETNGNTVDLSNPRAGSNWENAVIPCSAGDVFYVTGKGGTEPRLWAFVDSASPANVLSRADINYSIQTNVKVIAPTNSAYLVVNDGSGTGKTYKNDLLKDRLNTFGTAISELGGTLLYKSSVKKPTLFVSATMYGVNFTVNDFGDIAISGEPTSSIGYTSSAFLQMMNAKAVLTGKPSGAGSYYWVGLQESVDGETFTLISNPNTFGSNDAFYDLEKGKYYRIVIAFTNDSIGRSFNLSCTPLLYSSEYALGNTSEETCDTTTNIIIPHIVDTMEGHETNIYFDTLSKYEGMENLYKVNGFTNGMYRNGYCTRLTPTADLNTWHVEISLLDKNTALEVERKPVYFNVNHPLRSNLTKNVLIMGDSLTDADIIPQECYRLLAEDGDCTINRLGTLGSSGSENEGRSSWRWRDYTSASGTYHTNYDNPFWDEDNNRLDFQKYCQTNGYSGIDYMLINLGTNDALNMSVMDSPDGYDDVINKAKMFLTALLSADYGYPNCKVAIALLGIGPEYSARVYENANELRKKFNLLNIAYLNNFDNGIWNQNVTCFAVNTCTNRKYGYGYTETAISSRFSQLTIQEDDGGIHPSVNGYKSWADAYYCKIRTWLTEDSE